MVQLVQGLGFTTFSYIFMVCHWGTESFSGRGKFGWNCMKFGWNLYEIQPIFVSFSCIFLNFLFAYHQLICLFGFGGWECNQQRAQRNRIPTKAVTDVYLERAQEVSRYSDDVTVILGSSDGNYYELSRALQCRPLLLGMGWILRSDASNWIIIPHF